MKFRYFFYLGLIILIILWLYIGTNWIKITRTKVFADQLPKSISELKVIHLSDLHGKILGKENQKIIHTIHEENPDLIILSGDMINSHNDDGSAAVDLLEVIASQYPVYYAYGNHDQYCRLNTPEIFSKYEKKVRATGCTILDDQSMIFKKNNVSINIYGLTSIPYKKKVNIAYFDEDQFNAEFINETIGNASNEQFDLLIAHDPSWFSIYKKWGADIVFSGHIHGGAIRLPLLGGVVSPNRELFPKYDAGLFEEQEHYMYISRGLGTSVERIRIFNRPEIAVIIIQNEDIS